MQPFEMIPPKYVAEVICFLPSEKSRFITGTCIPISAGEKYIKIKEEISYDR